MTTRSVRLDEEAEAALSDIRSREHLSISDAIKRGLISYREQSLAKSTKKPADFFTEFDLGDGGYSLGPARDAKKIIRKKLTRKKHRS